MIAKIEVPNIFDEWYKGFPSADVRNKLAISEIAREGCGHSIILHTESRAYFEKSELNRLADFFNNNSKILIEMLNKYASEAYYVKPIKKYYIQLIKNNDGRAKFEEEKHIYRLANATLNGFSLYLTTNYDIQFSNNISKALELSKGELKFILTGTKFNQDQFEIVDLGDAKFPEQKYYVKLLDKEEGYLNYQKSFNDYFVNNNKYEDSDYQTQFTISEIEAIDPRYKAFAVPVEDK